MGIETVPTSCNDCHVVVEWHLVGDAPWGLLLPSSPRHRFVSSAMRVRSQPHFSPPFRPVLFPCQLWHPSIGNGNSQGVQQVSHRPGSCKVKGCYTFPSFSSCLPWKAIVNSSTSKDKGCGGMGQEWNQRRKWIRLKDLGNTREGDGSETP